jgi:hypothetical protein
MSKKTLFFILSIFWAITGKSQSLGFTLEGIGDNREFFSGLSQSETILGSRITLDYGTLVDSAHEARLGFCYFYEFGSTLGQLAPKPVLYYHYHGKQWQFKMGAFPRNNELDYPHAILSERFAYFRPTMEGLLLGYNTKKLQAGAWTDWISRQDSLNREQFLAGWTLKTNFNHFFGNFWGYLFHNAHRLVRLPGEHIEDNLGGLVTLGFDFSSLLPIEQMKFSTGIMFSMSRNRGESKKFTTGISNYTQFTISHRGLGMDAIYNRGDQHQFTFGDHFFRNTNHYLRTNLFITPINHPKIKGRFTWSFHITQGQVDHQQLFSLVYLFNSSDKR